MINAGESRVPQDNLLITQGKTIKIEQFIPSDKALQQWLSEQQITVGFILLQE
jgi:hypothetical protein